MKRNGIWAIVASVILVVALLVGGCSKPAPTPTPTPTPTPEPEWKPPAAISCTSYGQGSSGYVITLSLLTAFEKNTGIKARLEPADTDMARVLPLMKGDAEFSLTGGPTGWLAQRAMFEWADQGPQPLYVAYWSLAWTKEIADLVSKARGQPAVLMPIGLCTREDYDIYEIKDLKGKRMPWTPGYWYPMMICEGYLATADLTWDDVKKVTVSGYVGMQNALADGSTDASFALSVSSKVMEIDAAQGIRWIDLPYDEESWNKFVSIAPFMAKAGGNYGAGFGEGRRTSLDTAAYWSRPLVCAPGLDPDLAYLFTKTVDENQADWKDVSTELDWWWAVPTDIRIKDWLISGFLPIHPGSVKYFKEKGVWSAECQRHQEKLVAEQDEWIKAYQTKGKDYWVKNYGDFQPAIAKKIAKEIE